VGTALLIRLCILRSFSVDIWCSYCWLLPSGTANVRHDRIATLEISIYNFCPLPPYSSDSRMERLVRIPEETYQQLQPPCCGCLSVTTFLILTKKDSFLSWICSPHFYCNMLFSNERNCFSVSLAYFSVVIFICTHKGLKYGGKEK